VWARWYGVRGRIGIRRERAGSFNSEKGELVFVLCLSFKGMGDGRVWGEKGVKRERGNAGMEREFIENRDSYFETDTEEGEEFKDHVLAVFLEGLDFSRVFC
jgi:hypothetical protein